MNPPRLPRRFSEGFKTLPMISHLCNSFLAKQAGWADNQYNDQNDKRYGIAVGGTEERRAQAFGHAHHQAADHSAGQGTDAAEDCRSKRLK